jgi:hypothetical protein
MWKFLEAFYAAHILFVFGMTLIFFGFWVHRASWFPRYAHKTIRRKYHGRLRK